LADYNYAQTVGWLLDHNARQSVLIASDQRVGHAHYSRRASLALAYLVILGGVDLRPLPNASGMGVFEAVDGLVVIPYDAHMASGAKQRHHFLFNAV
jgi:hypothetical protein